MSIPCVVPSFAFAIFVFILIIANFLDDDSIFFKNQLDYKEAQSRLKPSSTQCVKSLYWI